MVTTNQILEETNKLNEHIKTHWQEKELFSFQWFVLILLILVCYILFFRLVEKRRFSEILLYGSLVAVCVSVYYSVGTFLGYWALLVAVLPFYPDFFASDLTIIPLLSMLVYQYTRSWRRYLIWYTVYSALLIFGLYDLLFGALKIFVYLIPPIVILDFLTFTILGFVIRWIMISMKKKEAKNGNAEAQFALSRLLS